MYHTSWCTWVTYLGLEKIRVFKRVKCDGRHIWPFFHDQDQTCFWREIGGVKIRVSKRVKCDGRHIWPFFQIHVSKSVKCEGSLTSRTMCTYYVYTIDMLSNITCIPCTYHYHMFSLLIPSSSWYNIFSYTMMYICLHYWFNLANKKSASLFATWSQAVIR